MKYPQSFLQPFVLYKNSVYANILNDELENGSNTEKLVNDNQKRTFESGDKFNEHATRFRLQYEIQGL